MLGLYYCLWAFSSYGLWGLLFLVLHRLLLAVASIVVEHRLLSLGSGVAAHCLVALRHVGSSWTRDQTSVSCIARRTLNLWTTKEASLSVF